MPTFKSRIVFEILRRFKAFVHVDVGLTRGKVPDPEQELNSVQRELCQARKQIAVHNKQSKRANQRTSSEKRSIKPENVVWIFGAGRTGSTWLYRMMTRHEEHVGWNEPFIGLLFPELRTGSRLSALQTTVFGEPHKEVWRESVRHLVLSGAEARFPEAGNKSLLIIKEPNASSGAPWLVDAFPKSRVVLLVRDPRDVIASILDSVQKDGWRSYAVESEMHADDLTSRRAQMYNNSITAAHSAFESHTGPKTLVRYEDLRAHTFGTVQRIYRELALNVTDADVKRVVEEFDWDNVPEDKKGPGKKFRKATPGGWREELTKEQVKEVEEITAPILQTLGYELSARATNGT